MRAPVPGREPGSPGPAAVAILHDGASTGRYQRKREDILTAAALVFNEFGIGAGTLAGIGDRVGLATNSVTYYYRRKEDLVSACFHRSIAAHLEYIHRAAAHPTVAARVRTYLTSQAEMLAGIATGDRPDQVVFSEVRTLEGTTGAEIHRAYVDMFRAVRALLAGDETAALARADLNARTHILLSAALFMRAWIKRVEPGQYTTVGARLADIVVNGLGSSCSAWQSGTGPGPGRVLVDAVDAPGDRFLRAATGLLNEKGYRGASVNRISARLNVTKGSFYHHIEHKDDLILACFERTLSAIRRAAAEAQALPVCGWEQVCTMSRSLGQLQVSSLGPLLRIGALGALPASDGRADAYRRMFQLTERIVDMIVTGMIDGSIRPLDPGIAAQFVSGSLNAMTELSHWLPGVAPDRLLDLYLKPVFEGVLTSPA